MSVPMSSRRRRLRVGLAGLAALGAACVALPGAAQAQVYGFFDTWSHSWRAEPPVRDLPPRRFDVEESLSRADIRDLLEGRGFTVTGAIRRNGEVYLVDVIDRRGRSARLVVDALDGHVLERFAGAPPRPAVGLRDDLPPESARSSRFSDERMFDEADSFADRRVLRERLAPQERGPAYSEPRVIEGLGPRATPPDSGQQSVARAEPEAGDSARPPLVHAPLPPRRPARADQTASRPGADSARPEAKPQAETPKAEKPKLPSQASRDPVGKRGATSRPEEAAKAAPGAVATSEAKPSADKPQNAPRVIPLFKVPQDQIRAEAEAAERATE